MDLHDQTLEMIRTIREMLDTLPIEWQVAAVKALTVRTILKAREQAQPARAITA